MKPRTIARLASIALVAGLAVPAHAETVLEEILARSPLVLNSAKTRLALELCVANVLSDEGVVSVLHGEDRTVVVAYHRENGLRGVKIKAAISLLETGHVEVRHADDKTKKLITPLAACL